MIFASLLPGIVCGFLFGFYLGVEAREKWYGDSELLTDTQKGENYGADVA